MSTVALGQYSQNVHAVLADELRPGDLVVNRGIVEATKHVGVFVIVRIRGTAWSLVLGTGDLDREDVTWHSAEEVLLVKPEE